MPDPSPLDRLRSVPFGSVGLAVAVLALALAAGAGAGASPLMATVVVGLLAATAVGLVFPATVLATALAAFVWQPQAFVPGLASYPQLQKVAVLAAGVLFVVRFGIDRRMALPLLAYPTMAALSLLGGTPVPGLTLGQAFSSGVTLTIAWVLFAVRWSWPRDVWVLKLVAWLPLVSVGVGAVLAAGGYVEFASSAPRRLGGALIAPYLASLAFSGLFAAAVLERRGTGWRPAQPLVVLNALTLGATVTRGAMLGAACLLAPLVWRYLRAALPSRLPVDALRTVALVLGLVAVAALTVPAIEGRESQTIFVPGRGVVTDDASSGRVDAWRYAYERASENLVFGRGLGAGPVVGGSYQSFLAQHNEYVRMVLEGGYVGGLIVLLAIVVVLCRATLRAPPDLRPLLVAALLGFAVYSGVDNTLTSSQSSVGFLTAFAVATAAGGGAPLSRRPGGRARPGVAPGRPC